MVSSDDFSNNKIVLVVTSKGKYNDSLGSIMPDIEKISAKIGYVTINKPFNSVLDFLEQIRVKKDKFLFVDAITATVQTPPNVDNCIFISSPTALTDLGLAFSTLYEKKCDIILFDTISTLAIYQDIGSVTKFVHNLVTKTRVLNKRAVFFALKEDSESLIKDLNMFVDKVVEI